MARGFLHYRQDRDVIMHRRIARTLCALAAVLAFSACLHAAPIGPVVNVVVVPDHPDWLYRVNERVTFTVSVLHFGNPVKNAEVRIVVRPEKMKPVFEKTMVLKNGTAEIGGYTMKTPGFLRCWAYVTVDGHDYNGCGTAGFDPLSIEPTTEEPADFMAFWDEAKAAVAKIPSNPRMVLMPEKCTDKVDVYHVSIQNFRPNNRVYGILCVPKKPGKYPALLRVPGAGIRPYSGVVDMAEKGMITLEIGIHGVPVTMDGELYTALNAPLNQYYLINLDDRNHYYYKRVYLGCVRAVDFICGLPQFDGENLAVTGSSQGGLLSFVTAALDKRVKYVAIGCPAYCDVTGYLHGRAGGWPHMFAGPSGSFANTEEKIETSKYYDAVNFARHVTVPGFFCWGFNDTTCPPTSMYSAYNVFNGPKELVPFLDARHWIYPEQDEMNKAWLTDRLLGTVAR